MGKALGISLVPYSFWGRILTFVVSLSSIRNRQSIMKKCVLSLLLLFVGAVQMASAQFRLEIGASLSNLKSASDKPTLSLSQGIGYRLGAAYEIGLLPMVYLAPGLQVRNNVVPVSSLNMGKVTYTDIAVPLNLGVSLSLGVVGLSIEGGAYLSYNVKSSYTAPSLNESIGTLGEISLDTFTMDKLRYGVGGSVALHFAKFYIRGGLDYDLNKLYKDDTASALLNAVKSEMNNLQSQNMTAYLSIGVRL